MVLFTRFIGTLIVMGLSTLGFIKAMEWFDDNYERRNNVVPIRRV